MLRLLSIPLPLIFALAILASPSISQSQSDDPNHADDEEGHEHAEATGRAPVTELPAAEALVEVNGLVCSFCAFGAEKAVKKLPFLDSERFNSGVEVNIDKHQMRLALKANEPIDYKRLALSLRAAGYEPLDIYLRVRGNLVKSEAGFVLSGPGVEYALQSGDTIVSPSDEPVQLLIRVDGRMLHELPPGEQIRASAIRLYES